MAEWIINKDKYDGRPRWYTCPICRYTYDDTIDHVSDTGYCTNCQNKIGGPEASPKDVIVKRDHLLVIAGVIAAEMAAAGIIEIYNARPDEIDLSTFITHIVDQYCELDRDMIFDEYVRNNLMRVYS